jgi:bifunctional UDP-N-acetylglucosamine pyrophosphorylase/glucosamine-1-phosphate N-acetyltransferase
MIFYSVRLALQLRPRQTVVIVGHQAGAVTAAVRRDFPHARITFAKQTQQLGTAHAVLQAKRALRGFVGDVLILSGDVPLLPPATLREFRRRHARSDADLTSMATIMDDPTGYGRWLRDAGGQLLRVVEQKDATDEQKKIQEINAGIYLVRAPLLWRVLARVGRDNAQREMYLTDAVHLTRELGGRVGGFVMEPAHLVLGINSRVELAEAARTMRLAMAGELMRRGVTIVDPHTTYLDWGVAIGRDTVIEPNVMLTGRTRIGRNCRLSWGARLDDVRTGDRVSIGPHVFLQNCRIKSGERVILCR